MFKDLINEMIDGGTLPTLTKKEKNQLNKDIDNNIISFIVELENDRKYLDIKL